MIVSRDPQPFLCGLVRAPECFGPPKAKSRQSREPGHYVVGRFGYLCFVFQSLSHFGVFRGVVKNGVDFFFVFVFIFVKFTCYGGFSPLYPHRERHKKERNKKTIRKRNKQIENK